MNNTALFAGIIIALATIKLFNSPKVNTQYIYTWLLASLPVYYWLFAAYSGDFIVLFKETLVAIIFISLAWYCMLLNNRNYPLLLSMAYLLHAAYDLTHSSFFINPGSPLWWPEFCAVIDLILGLYIASFIVRQPRRSHSIYYKW